MGAELLREAAGEMRFDAGLFSDADAAFYDAVADWLDATAEAHTHDESGGVIDVWSLPGMDQHPAVKVAAAYLGRES
jgi:hypothetical protein